MKFLLAAALCLAPLPAPAPWMPPDELICRDSVVPPPGLCDDHFCFCTWVVRPEGNRCWYLEDFTCV